MVEKERKAIIIDAKDNVGNALQDLKSGSSVDLEVENGQCNVLLQEDIPYGFKFSLQKINKGELIKKYGELIGKATEDIDTGCLVHVHNVEGMRGRGDVKKD